MKIFHYDFFVVIIMFSYIQKFCHFLLFIPFVLYLLRESMKIIHIHVRQSVAVKLSNCAAALAPNVPATWRRRGIHCGLDESGSGCSTLKCRTSHAPACAKPPVRRRLFLFVVFIVFQFLNLSYFYPKV